MTASTAASSRKTWALRCACGLDVRNCDLTDDEASDFLDRVDSSPDEVISALLARGATGEPRLPKAARERNYNNLLSEAQAAGMAAGAAHKPTPMHVVERANPLDDSSPITRQHAPVLSGVCGFAWVNITPGNSGFARWLLKNGYARKAYRGGVDIWISEYSQSMERKEAHARAMADVFRAAGIKAYAQSRMD